MIYLKVSFYIGRLHETVAFPMYRVFSIIMKSITSFKTGSLVQRPNMIPNPFVARIPYICSFKETNKALSYPLISCGNILIREKSGGGRKVTNFIHGSMSVINYSFTLIRIPSTPIIRSVRGPIEGGMTRFIQ